MLRSLEKELVGKLSSFDPDDVSQRAARMRKLQGEIDVEIKRRFDLISKEATGELEGLAKDEAQWKAKSLGNTWNSLGITADVALASTEVLNALTNQPIVLGGVAASYWKSEGAALSAKFAQQMQLGISGGENIGDLIKRVRGSKANNFADGIMSVSRRNAESLVRTSVNSVANAAHVEVYKANSDIVQGLQHYSILDSRTTVICSARQGLRWRMDTLEPVGHDVTFASPPLHWRCRSIIVSILDMDAEPETTNFDDWFKSLSTKQQDDLFGQGRAQLWREGRIGQSDLLNQNGRPLTLKQLIAEHGAPKPIVPPSPAQDAATALAKALQASNDSAKHYVFSEGQKHGVEFLVAVDDHSGLAFANSRGQRSSVSFPAEVSAAARDPARSITLHHNHPSSSSLSLPDLRAANMPGVKGGIWAHGHDGSSYFAKGTGTSLLEGKHRVMTRRVGDELAVLVKAKKVTFEDANRMYWHMVNRGLNARGVIQYDFALNGETAEIAKRMEAVIDDFLAGLA